MVKPVPDIINSVAEEHEELDRMRVLTESMSHAVLSAHVGESFNCEQLYTLNADEPLYVLFENPLDSGVNVELISRLFQTDSDGADLLVLWDYDVSSATKTSLTSYNEHVEYDDSKTAALEVSVLNTVVVDATTGIATVSDDANVTDQGSIREPSFITSSGVGSNQSGDINEQIGSRIYAPGTGFLTKITSRGNSNLTLFGYTWLENQH